VFGDDFVRELRYVDGVDEFKHVVVTDDAGSIMSKMMRPSRAADDNETVRSNSLAELIGCQRLELIILEDETPDLAVNFDHRSFGWGFQVLAS
jgi:hypothetical protein